MPIDPHVEYSPAELARLTHTSLTVIMRAIQRGELSALRHGARGWRRVLGASYIRWQEQRHRLTEPQPRTVRRPVLTQRQAVREESRRIIAAVVAATTREG